MRRFPPIRVMACLTAFLAALVAPCTPAPATDAHAAVPGHLRVATGSNARWPNPAGALKYQVVVLNSWNRRRIPMLKAANPKVKVLLYKNLAASRAASASGHTSTGVPLSEVRPEWYLRDTTLAPIRFRNYPELYAMDIGSESYQERWGDNVLAELRGSEFDGVFMDDVNLTMRYHYSGLIPKYPTDADYQRAMGAAVANLGARIRAEGKLAYANIGSWSETDAFADTGIEWTGHVSGAMEEHFVKWSENYAAEVRWYRSVRIAKAVQRSSRHFLAVTTAARRTDRKAARYGWATVLLAADGGRISYAMHAGFTGEVSIPEYSYDLGAPTSGMRSGLGGVQSRTFEKGEVFVNPTETSAPVSFSGTFSGSGLTDARSAVMQPKSALILAKPERVRVVRDGLRVRVVRQPDGDAMLTARCVRRENPCRSRVRVIVGGSAVRTLGVKLAPGESIERRVSRLDGRPRVVITSR
jgi:hypothetical protein